MRASILILLACIGGCDDPQVEREQPPSEEEPAPPRCSTDSDCVAVDVFCGGRSAEHRDVADEVQRGYERQAAVSNCGRARWAVPEVAEAYCVEGGCGLRILYWSDKAECEGETACVALRDPCLGEVAVTEANAAAVAEAMVESERIASCANRQRAVGLEVGSTETTTSKTASCRAGFCRIDE